VTTGKKKTVFVLDDSEITLELIRTELSEAGFRVLATDNLVELDRMALTGSPDLVLLDVQMPELFGDDVGIVLREVHGLRCPIYLLSSLEPHELAVRAADAGADGYICKKDGMEAVVARVKEILV
jgi:DNA-binding response OmpR family regulator